MLPLHIKIGVAMGIVLVCIGITLNYLPILQPTGIDPGPSVKSITVSGFIFSGINVIIISAIFLLRFALRSHRKDMPSEFA